MATYEGPKISTKKLFESLSSTSEHRKKTHRLAREVGLIPTQAPKPKRAPRERNNPPMARKTVPRKSKELHATTSTNSSLYWETK